MHDSHGEPASHDQPPRAQRWGPNGPLAPGKEQDGAVTYPAPLPRRQAATPSTERPPSTHAEGAASMSPAQTTLADAPADHAADLSQEVWGLKGPLAPGEEDGADEVFPQPLPRRQPPTNRQRAGWHDRGTLGWRRVMGAPQEQPQAAPARSQPAGPTNSSHWKALSLGDIHTSALAAFRQAWYAYLLLGLVYLPLFYVFASVLPIVHENVPGLSGLPQHFEGFAETVEEMGITSFHIKLIGAAVVLLFTVVTTMTAHHTHETGTGNFSDVGFGPALLAAVTLFAVNKVLTEFGLSGYVLSVIVSVFTMFATAAAAHGVGFGAAFRESYQIVTHSPGTSIALTLVLSFYTVIGMLTCFLASIALGPFVILLVVTAYRRAKGLTVNAARRTD